MYAEKGGLFFSSTAPRISLPGTAYANVGGSINITKWRHIVVNSCAESMNFWVTPTPTPILTHGVDSDSDSDSGIDSGLASITNS